MFRFCTPETKSRTAWSGILKYARWSRHCGPKSFAAPRRQRRRGDERAELH